MSGLAAADPNSDRLLGAALVTLSACVFGLAGGMTKAISSDPMTILCWRGLIGGSIILLYVLARNRGRGLKGLRLGKGGWLVAIVGALASIAFISAFKYTFVANAAIIYATVPFAAALLGWLMAGEALRRQTFVAALISFVGVGITAWAGLHAGSIAGDSLALLMTALSALYIVLIRIYRDSPVVFAGAVSSFILFGLGWVVGDPLSVTGHDAVLLAIFGASFAFAVILWTEGARLIPSSESGLLGLAEVPFAIMFAALMLGEYPPQATLLGGVIVMLSVIWHAGRDWRAARRPPA